MATSKKKKATSKPVKKEPLNLDELTAIQAELVKLIPGGDTVETRQAMADRLQAAIESLKS